MSTEAEGQQEFREAEKVHFDALVHSLHVTLEIYGNHPSCGIPEVKLADNAFGSFYRLTYPNGDKTHITTDPIEFQNHLYMILRNALEVAAIMSAGRTEG